MASLLAPSNRLNSILIACLLMIFIGSLYYWLYLKKPSIATAFDQQSFKLNFLSFKNSVLHAHLYYQVKSAQECLIDCYLRDSVGLDFNHFGFPITTRFVKTENLTKIFDFNTNLNDHDCTLVWKFLMGPLHDSINTKKGGYLASWNIKDEICIFKTTKVPNQRITYDSINGHVELIQLKPIQLKPIQLKPKITGNNLNLY